MANRPPGIAATGFDGFGADDAARRRARAGIDASFDPAMPPAPGSGRRLTEEERRALQERARARAISTPPPKMPTTARTPTAPPRMPASRPAPPAPRPGGSPTTRKPPPRMPRPKEETTVRSRGMVALGTLLIVALTVLAFAGGRLFGAAPAPDDGGRDEFAARPPAIIASPLPEDPEPEPETTQPQVALGQRGPVVCLDPGHGGPDRGFTRGPLGNLASMEEASIVLQLAWDLEARLQARGVGVVVTRESDAAVNATRADINGDGKTARDDRPGNDRFATLDELQARINICNAAKADLLVSMHVNGYSTQKPRGYETWFTEGRPFSDRSRTFANLAYVHLKDQLGRIGYVLPPEEERGVNPDTVADVQEEYAVFKNFIITGPEVPGSVKPSEMPGAIVETLFVSNDGDASLLVSAEGLNAIVTAYENAIVEYFQRNPPER